MSNDESYVAKQNAEAKLRLGRELTNRDWLDMGLMQGEAERAATIRALDSDLDGEMSLEKRAKLMQLRRHLTDQHHTMRRAGR